MRALPPFLALFILILVAACGAESPDSAGATSQISSALTLEDPAACAEAARESVDAAKTYRHTAAKVAKRCGAQKDNCDEWIAALADAKQSLDAAHAATLSACTGAECTPNCAGKECGGDGCGGSCGTCADGKACQYDGTCIDPTPCNPDCTGKECGGDGCGGTCGSCVDGLSCRFDGICVEPAPCKPDCAGKECGGDGCGGTCGVCIDGLSCSFNGTCQ